MKMDWKKVSLTTVSLASALTLAACTKPAEKPAESAKDDNAVLKVSVDTGYETYINSIKEKFEKENNVKIELSIDSMTENLDKLPTDGPTGAAADVMIAPYDRVGRLGKEGQITEVKLGNEAQFDETVKNLVTIDGTVFASPAVVESLVLYYNKDLVSDAPKTFAELEALAKDAKFAFPTEEGKTVAFLANWTNFYYAFGLVGGYGGYVFGEHGTNPKDLGLDNEGAIKGLEYAQKWYGMWPQGMRDTTKAGDFVLEQFNSGKAAAIIEGPWQAAAIKEAGINYGVAQIPMLDSGKGYEAFGGGKAWVISNYSKNKEVAQKWVDYVTNEENQKSFYDATQEIPANLAARDYASSKGNEISSAVIAQFKNAQPMPNLSEMAEVWEPGATMFFDAASGKNAAEAAHAAVATIKDAIEQKHAQ